MYRVQKGFTLIEMIVVLALIGIATTTLMGYVLQGVEKDRETITAQHMKRIVTGAEKYIQDNYATLLSSATATTPAVVSMATLKSGGHVGATVPDNNAYGQTYELRVLEPTTGQLSAMLVTSGGEVISERSLRRIARQVGPEGGYVSLDDQSQARGIYSGWTATLSTYGAANGAGRMVAALFFRDNAQVSDFIYRGAVTGRPELNTMGTGLNMGGNAITNAAGVTASGTVQAGTITATGQLNVHGQMALSQVVASGGSCTPNGMIARDPAGYLASCVSGVWTVYTPGGGSPTCPPGGCSPTM